LSFDELFHAVRLAALCYLDRDTSGWRKVDKVLPPPFAEQFRAMTQTLHIQYGYEGRIPRGTEAAEFKEWNDKVRTFVDAMRQRTQTCHRRIP